MLHLSNGVSSYECVLFKVFFFSVEQVQYQVNPNQSLSSFFQAKIIFFAFGIFACLYHTMKCCQREKLH